MEDDTPVEAPDVPEKMPQSDGGTVATQNAQAPFDLKKYKHGGKVGMSTCKMSTHEKNKASPNW
jgi:hypothetical protein